ncbi:MAG TPA: Nif11-like leader peptide family natural product precursor [Allocoleopsis sp.]
MSQSAVIEFFQAAELDQALQAQLASADSAASIVEMAATSGYGFTESELTEIAAQAQQMENGELSDSELEAVAGGGWGSLFKVIPIVAPLAIYGLKHLKGYLDNK